MATNSLVFEFLGRDRASKTFDKIGNKSDGLRSKLKSFGGLAARALGGAAVAAAGLAVAGAVMGVKTAAALEQAGVAFETLLGSAEKAQKFIGKLTTFAKQTPFELPGLVSAARQLLGVGQSAETVIPTLTAWGDAAGALGLSQEQFNRVMLAVTQSMSKGKIQAEELMQMTEAGIPIWPLLAKAMGKTVPELQALSSQGKLMAEDVFPRLEAQMAKDYGGSMAKQSQTLSGLWSTLMDTINVGLATAILPLQDELKTGLTTAIEIAGAALERLPGVIQSVSDKLGPFVSFIRDDFAPGAVAAFTTVKDGVSEVFGDLFGDVDWGSLATGLLARAESIAETFVSAIRTGVETGDWGPLGSAIGEAIGDSVTQSGTLAANVVGWFVGLDWASIGLAVGASAIPFIGGFISGFASATGPALKQLLADHWFDILVFAITTAFLPLRILKIVGTVLSKIPFVGKLVAWFFNAFVSISKAVIPAVGRFLLGIFAAFGKGIIGPGGVRVITTFSGWLARIPTAIGVAAINVAAAAGRMMARFRGAILGWAGRIGTAVSGIFSWVIRPFRHAGSWLLSAGGRIMSGLRSGITAGFTSVSLFLWSIPGKILSVFRNAGGWLVGAGKRIVGGLISGLKSMRGSLAGTAGGIAGIVTRFFPFSPAKEGPLRTHPPEGWGVNIMSGLIDGIGSKTSALRSQLGDVTGMIGATSPRLGGRPGIAATGPALTAGGGRTQPMPTVRLADEDRALLLAVAGRPIDARLIVDSREIARANDAGQQKQRRLGKVMV